MNTVEDIFGRKRPKGDNLLQFGFAQEGGAFVYREAIADGEMSLCVRVENGVVSADVYDCETGDEYVLHTVDGASGEFVGRVRADFERVLCSIADSCCEQEAFKLPQTKRVIEYFEEKFGAKLEFLWNDLPDAAIVRRADNAKWFGLLMTIRREKLGAGEGPVEVMNVRSQPEVIEKIVDGVTFFRAYHMNKKYWLTVCLDGSAETERIFELIDKSYEAVGKK